MTRATTRWGRGLVALGLSWALAGGCAPDLSDDLDDQDDKPAGDAPTLDASGEDDWVGFDLDAGEVVGADDATADLRFRRVAVEQSDGVETVAIDGGDYDGLSEAPADGYVADTDELAVFETWYVYDYVTHLLSPADVVYVVHTDDAYVKLRFVNYYDEAGTSGMYRLDHAPVDPPATGGR